jgi:hypothetical protein
MVGHPFVGPREVVGFSYIPSKEIDEVVIPAMSLSQPSASPTPICVSPIHQLLLFQ